MYVWGYLLLLCSLALCEYSSQMATGSNLNGEIAARIRGAAIDAGVTHKDLALAAGIPDRTLARLLVGQADWRVNQVYLVANALEVDLHTLLMGRAG